MPFPMVVKDVMTRLFSLTAAEYPAATLTPKLLIQPWIIIFPTEIKDCCKMLGTAIAAVFLNKSNENNKIRPSVLILDRRFNTMIRDKTQLAPWQRKVAQATPETPMEKYLTNKTSAKIFALEDAARKRKGVLESPSAEKIPVAML